MKLSETVAFNQQNLKFEGFTDLGKYTPEHQKKKKGDHALVIMFQPFKEKWVQTLGCFLSKGSATGTVLHQILLEATILAERAGLRVDGITCDGASWNRTMWNLFGINDSNVSIEHVVDPKRRLWFFSDFPHLIKCLRNFFSKQDKHDEIWTPDGAVSLKHWYALLELENPKGFQLKVNKLREQHIKPRYYQKMNVAMAFQFFGEGDTMRFFKDKHDDLKDSEGSIQFCSRVHKLIKAMNSRTPIDNLKPNNEQWKNIESFINFLEEWEKTAKKQDNNFEFMAEGTCYGLKITLKGALQICQFLVDQRGFNYLMTARLNQDSLERFFGIMRYCCGSNDHPDSLLFIQMYKLISTYSLVKPPKGSNVTGSDIMKVLIEIKDIKNVDERRRQWDAQIDTILDRAVKADTLADAAALFEEHDYFKCSTSDYVIAYVSGFVARKSSRFCQQKILNSKGQLRATVCQRCMGTVSLKEGEKIPESYELIKLRNKGALFNPSIQFFNLISKLEKSILEIVSKGIIDSKTIFDVTGVLENLTPLPLVGCEEHAMLFTHRVITFFLTTRMLFVAKQINKNDSMQKENTREKRKLSKLQTNASTADNEAVSGEEQVSTFKTKSKRTSKRKSAPESSQVQAKKRKTNVVSKK